MLAVLVYILLNVVGWIFVAVVAARAVREAREIDMTQAERRIRIHKAARLTREANGSLKRALEAGMKSSGQAEATSIEAARGYLDAARGLLEEVG